MKPFMVDFPQRWIFSSTFDESERQVLVDITVAVMRVAVTEALGAESKMGYFDDALCREKILVVFHTICNICNICNIYIMGLKLQ